MLIELAVHGLGVIDDLSLVFGRGMTALTGETGAGKTLVVTAIDLLVGGRADATVVGEGHDEAVVEGRFELGGDEVVLRRVVPADGRSRAYIDGRLATVGELAEHGARLVDLHGQHSHQSLLSTAAQRDALDRFAGVDLAPRDALRHERSELIDRLAELGGDERERAREIDLLRYQVDELGEADPQPGEDEALEAEEALLADARAHLEAGAAALELLTGDTGIETQLGEARHLLGDRGPLAAFDARLRALGAEVADVAHELRAVFESVSDDPERLATVRARRQLLHELRRKYGATLAEVLEYGRTAAARIDELEQREARAAEIEARLAALAGELEAVETAIGDRRRRAAPGLGAAATAHLSALALPDAQLLVDVGADRAGDAVELLFTANQGGTPRPLRKIASGGELARVMLALRLVLTAGPDTLVFDEVDAGIGGAAALAVGRSLAELGHTHQVLVVTHLPQVAAYADAQAAVTKSVARGQTRTDAAVLDDEARVIELSRMLSGSPGSDRAHEHAAELMATAAAERGR
jgi:DNA repair protein RecN (Recombination protein N)